MKKLYYPPNTNANLIFILPASYIVEDFVKNILISRNWLSVTIYFDIKNTSPGFLSYLHELTNVSDKVYLNKITTFEFRGVAKHKELIKKIKTNFKSSNTETYLYIQSLEQLLCRLLANSYFKYSSNIFIIGLQFSLPVFLFRDPKYVAKLVSNRQLKEFLFLRADKIKITKNDTNMSLLTKKFTLKIIEYLFDLFFLEKKFRINRMVTATSYVQRGVVDLHLVGKNFYKFCLKQIYYEPVNLIEVTKQSGNYIKNNTIEIYDNLDLIILGPVSHLMIDCYMVDVKKLISINYKFRNIYIKPHPRFRPLARKLVDLLRTQKIKGVPKNICILNQIPLDAASSVLIGYYSSLFDELIGSNYKGMCIISERATNCRYPEMPVNVLSGEKFGFGNPYIVLDNRGDLVGSSKPIL